MNLVRFFVGCLAALWREYLWPRPRLLSYQAKQLRRLLRHAKNTVPLYRDLYRDIDVDNCSLQQLPTVTKPLLLSRFADSVSGEPIDIQEVEAFSRRDHDTKQLLRGRYIVSTTSGTTGRVGYFLVREDDWNALNGMVFGRMLREYLALGKVVKFGPWRRYRMAFLVATGGPYISYLLGTHRPGGSGLVNATRAFSITEHLPTTLAALEKFQPHYLHGYTTFIELLARYQLAGRVHLAPQVITLGSESVSLFTRELIERAFPNTSVRETYGATECIGIANQCRLGRLHVNEDICVLEPVDQRGNPVPSGERSDRILVTNLVAYAQPLIRYDISDQVVLDPTPCACGSNLQTIRVSGRTDDSIYLRDSTGQMQQHPPISFEVLFLRIAGLAQYQLLHTRQNHLQIRFVCQGPRDAAEIEKQVRSNFVDYLAKHGLRDQVTLHLVAVEQIERDPISHKIRQIASDVPIPDEVEVGR